MERKVALVAGASGIIGRGIVECLTQRADWEVKAGVTSLPARSQRSRVDRPDTNQAVAASSGLRQIGCTGKRMRAASRAVAVEATNPSSPVVESTPV